MGLLACAAGAPGRMEGCLGMLVAPLSSTAGSPPSPVPCLQLRGTLTPWSPFPLQIPASIKLYLVSAVDSASILLVIQGTAVGTSTAAASEMALQRGSVLFISANESISLQLSSPDGMLLFRACCLL